MNFVYLAFGTNITYHKEAAFSIVSLLAKGRDAGTVYVYTDAPQFYKMLSSVVVVKEVSSEQLAEWKGRYDYFYRTKVKVLQDICRISPGKPIVFIDSDTFFYKDCSAFFNGINAGKVFMHKEEKAPGKGKASLEKKFWQRFGGKVFGSVKITERHTMWNSGVIAIPVDRQLEAILLTEKICDDLLEDMAANGYYTHILEQLAFSVSLQETYANILPSDNFIGHYWGNKDGWHIEIDKFFSAAYVEAKSVDQTVEAAGAFDYTSIPYLRRTHNLYHKLVEPFSRRCYNRKAKYIVNKF